VGDSARVALSMLSRGGHNKFASSPDVLGLGTRDEGHEEDGGRSSGWRLGSHDTIHMLVNHETHC